MYTACAGKQVSVCNDDESEQKDRQRERERWRARNVLINHDWLIQSPLVFSLSLPRSGSPLWLDYRDAVYLSLPPLLCLSLHFSIFFSFLSIWQLPPTSHPAMSVYSTGKAVNLHLTHLLIHPFLPSSIPIALLPLPFLFSLSHLLCFSLSLHIYFFPFLILISLVLRSDWYVAVVFEGSSEMCLSISAGLSWSCWSSRCWHCCPSSVLTQTGSVKMRASQFTRAWVNILCHAKVFISLHLFTLQIQVGIFFICIFCDKSRQFTALLWHKRIYKLFYLFNHYFYKEMLIFQLFVGPSSNCAFLKGIRKSICWPHALKKVIKQHKLLNPFSKCNTAVKWHISRVKQGGGNIMMWGWFSGRRFMQSKERMQMSVFSCVKLAEIHPKRQRCLKI